ncbi:mevalonate kinase [Lapidilactobacillus mulanensis]|uniref:Mevalonate kinase n=1 Tax=Lapidilactobacillus mulanensis TaxID=2485999 RepID=A0ABW4DNL5_9LACO|nr:mevalonate kinase [Lapidilactobacillus mulanensis]
MEKVGYGNSHAKLILVGEHAVVYGVPAIAIPLKDIEVNVTTRGTGSSNYDLPTVQIESELFTGSLQTAPENLQNIEALVAKFMADFAADFNWPQELQLTIDSQIPFERGMGSSAAIATAVLKSLLDFTSMRLTDDQFNQLITLEETIQHGNPSGLDALVVNADQGYFFQRGHAFLPLQLNLPGYLLIVDSGITGRTSEAIQKVAALHRDQPQLWQAQMDRIAQLAPQVKTLLATDTTIAQQQLGQLLTENQAALESLQVSTPELDTLIHRLIIAGASGAKLTGGGLGGCVFGYFTDQATAKKAQEQFTEKTWLTELAADHHELEKNHE